MVAARYAVEFDRLLELLGEVLQDLTIRVPVSHSGSIQHPCGDRLVYVGVVCAEEFVQAEVVLVFRVCLVDTVPHLLGDQVRHRDVPEPHVLYKLRHIAGSVVAVFHHPAYPFGIEVPGTEITTEKPLQRLQFLVLCVPLVVDVHVRGGSGDTLYRQVQPSKVGRNHRVLQRPVEVGCPGEDGGIHLTQVCTEDVGILLPPDRTPVDMPHPVDVELGEFFGVAPGVGGPGGDLYPGTVGVRRVAEDTGNCKFACCLLIVTSVDEVLVDRRSMLFYVVRRCAIVGRGGKPHCFVDQE